jgi:hypothetical protein
VRWRDEKKVEERRVVRFWVESQKGGKGRDAEAGLERAPVAGDLQDVKLVSEGGRDRGDSRVDGEQAKGRERDG